MKDNRDKQMAQLAGWTWDLTGYAEKVPFYNADDLTMREVQNVFQLDPEPPQMELNGYIGEAVRKRDLSYFSFFLHHFEKRASCPAAKRGRPVSAQRAASSAGFFPYSGGTS